jgi:hypothetical protein
MNPHDDNPAAKATALVGAVTQQALSTAGRLAFAGVSTSLHVLGHANSLRKRIRRTGDTALQLAAVTPLGRLLPEPRYDDGAELEGHRIAHPPAEPRVTRPAAPTRATPVAEPPAPEVADVADVPAHEVSAAAKEAGAPGAATAAADAAVAAVEAAEDLPPEPSRDDLPIPDFDSVTVPSLRSRLRRLSVADLAMLREYEQAHAHRLPVLTMLDNRIAKLAAEQDPAT